MYQTSSIFAVCFARPGPEKTKRIALLPVDEPRFIAVVRNPFGAKPFADTERQREHRTSPKEKGG